MKDNTNEEKKLRHRKTKSDKSDKNAVSSVKHGKDENKKQRKP